MKQYLNQSTFVDDKVHYRTDIFKLCYPTFNSVAIKGSVVQFTNSQLEIEKYL